MKQLLAVPVSGIKAGDIIYDYRHNKLVKVRYITERRVDDMDYNNVYKYFIDFMPVEAIDTYRDYEDCEDIDVSGELYKLVDIEELLQKTKTEYIGE